MHRYPYLPTTQDDLFVVPVDSSDVIAPVLGGYVPTSGTLTLNPNETSRVISIEVKGDADPESDEEFRVPVSASSEGTTISRNKGIGAILNDDAAADSTAPQIISGPVVSSVTSTRLFPSEGVWSRL